MEPCPPPEFCRQQGLGLHPSVEMLPNAVSGPTHHGRATIEAPSLVVSAPPEKQLEECRHQSATLLLLRLSRLRALHCRRTLRQAVDRQLAHPGCAQSQEVQHDVVQVARLV